MRVMVVEHKTCFKNHYPEGWEEDDEALCWDVNEPDHRWLITARNFRFEVPHYYHNELCPAELVSRIPGLRIAFLSEPMSGLLLLRRRQSEQLSVRPSFAVTPEKYAFNHQSKSWPNQNKHMR